MLSSTMNECCPAYFRNEKIRWKLRCFLPVMSLHWACFLVPKNQSAHPTPRIGPFHLFPQGSFSPDPPPRFTPQRAAAFWKSLQVTGQVYGVYQNSLGIFSKQCLLKWGKRNGSGKQ